MRTHGAGTGASVDTLSGQKTGGQSNHWAQVGATRVEPDRRKAGVAAPRGVSRSLGVSAV